MNVEILIISVRDSEWTLVRLSETGLYTAATDEYVGSVVEFTGKVNSGFSVSRCWFRLESLYLHSHMGEEVTLPIEEFLVVQVLIAKDFSRNREALAIDQIGRGCADVGFKCGSDGE